MLARLLFAAVALCLIGALPDPHAGRAGAREGAAFPAGSSPAPSPAAPAPGSPRPHAR